MPTLWEPGLCPEVFTYRLLWSCGTGRRRSGRRDALGTTQPDAESDVRCAPDTYRQHGDNLCHHFHIVVVVVVVVVCVCVCVCVWGKGIRECRSTGHCPRITHWWVYSCFVLCYVTRFFELWTFVPQQRLGGQDSDSCVCWHVRTFVTAWAKRWETETFVGKTIFYWKNGSWRLSPSQTETFNSDQHGHWVWGDMNCEPQTHLETSWQVWKVQIKPRDLQ